MKIFSKETKQEELIRTSKNIIKIGETYIIEGHGIRFNGTMVKALYPDEWSNHFDDVFWYVTYLKDAVRGAELVFLSQHLIPYNKAEADKPREVGKKKYLSPFSNRWV